MSKKRAAVVRCVGCEEHVAEAEKVAGLGYVCPMCMEVLPIVWETALENVREAQRAIDKFIAEHLPAAQRVLALKKKRP